MSKGSLFRRLAANAVAFAAAFAVAAALFFCGAMSVYAEQSDYAAIDKLYSSDGGENIYISEDQFLYNFKGENPGVTLCGYVGESTTLDIPHLINGREVSAIDKDAFKGDDRIEKVIFPNSVKTIGENSFSGCSKLKTIELATGVNELYQVFNDCPALESMFFPQGVGSIRDSFKNCTGLSYVRFSRSVTNIGEYSFTGCTSLTQIDWLGGIIKLNNSFDNCTALESVSIPEGVVLIDGAFDGCASLKEVSFPETLLYITGGFTNCSSLTRLQLPSKLLYVNEAFNNCENLSKLKYSESTSISETAFLDCPKLVVEKENKFFFRLLGWIAVLFVMALAGYITFRLLTNMAENLSREYRNKNHAGS